MKSNFESVSAFLTVGLQDFSNICFQGRDQLLFTEYPCRDSDLRGEGLAAVLTGYYRDITSETLHSNLQWMYGNNLAAPCKRVTSWLSCGNTTALSCGNMTNNFSQRCKW